MSKETIDEILESMRTASSQCAGYALRLKDAMGDARLRGEAAQPDLHAHLLDMLGVSTHEEAGAEIGRLHGLSAQGEQQAVATIEECAEVVWHQGGPCQLAPGTNLYVQPTTSLDRHAIRMLVAAGYVSEAKANEALQIAHGWADVELSAAPAAPDGGVLTALQECRDKRQAAPAPVAGDAATEDMVRAWAWKLQKAMRYTESGHRCDIRTAADAVFQSMTAALAQYRASQGAAAGGPVQGWQYDWAKHACYRAEALASKLAGTKGAALFVAHAEGIADLIRKNAWVDGRPHAAPTQGAEREVSNG